MSELAMPWLEGPSLRPVLELLVLRTLPFMVYVCLWGKVALWARIGTLAAWLALSACLGPDARSLWMLNVMAYYAAACIGVRWLGVAHRHKVLSAGATFTVGAVVFLLIPGMLLPKEATLSVLVVGWELSLASYSYCRETRSLKRAPALGECVFFLMVNPVLVFAERGSRTGPIRLTWPATVRMGWGLAGVLLSAAVLRPTQRYLTLQDTGAGLTGAAWTLLVLGSLRFLAVYFAHSGLANLRIGLMRQLGHQVPECFNYPMLASGPLDFWRRWNVYVTSWLKRYVFLPLSKSSSLRRLGPLGMAGAVFFTFLISGLVHEMHAYVLALQLVGRFTVQFALAGGVVVAWLALDRALYALARRTAGTPRGTLQFARKLTARVVAIVALLGIPFVWG